MIFFVVGETVYKMTSKLPNLPSGNLQFIYTFRTWSTNLDDSNSLVLATTQEEKQMLKNP